MFSERAHGRAVPMGRLPWAVRGVFGRRGWRDGAGRYLAFLLSVGIECFVRLDRHGGAPQRTRASIGPYCVAGARTPRALHRSMTADRLIPRHGHGGVCSSICVAPGPRRCGDDRRIGWLLAQRCLGRLLHRGGTAA